MNCQSCPFLNAEKIIITTVRRTVEELGVVSKYISRQEALQFCSSTMLRRAEERGGLTKYKDGIKNEKVFYLRSQFEHWINLKKK